jgi:hypothetical protein
LRLIDDSRTIVRPLSVTNSIRASRHCGGSGLSSPAPIHSPHADAIRAHQRLSSPAPIHSPHADAIRGHQRLSSPAPIHSPHSAPCPLARLRAAPSNTARPQSMALSGHQVQSVVLWWRAVRTFEKTIVDRDARRARVDDGHSAPACNEGCNQHAITEMPVVPVSMSATAYLSSFTPVELHTLAVDDETTQPAGIVVHWCATPA